MLSMEIAGLPGARIFPGSWSEWSANPERPVEK
jgi:thiosulfate/3-mercaptopyruvate sulfurtransferase